MKRLVYLFLSLFVCAQICRSQQTVTSATLVGQIEDRGSARVNAAVITVKNLETNQEFTTTSDYDGHFKIPLLRVGTYSLQITAEGFEAFSEKLTLSLAQTIDLKIKLDVLGFKEVVNVNASVPAIETQRTQVAETIRPH
jgi:carboxypeptidase family protein